MLTANDLQLQVNYAGGRGNDVVLTVTNTALRQSRCFVTTGNLNGAVDPNECNLLYVVVTNVGPDSVTGISASLLSHTPGVSVMQSVSFYPDLAAGGAGRNAIPFQISALPGFVCGRRIDLDLVVSTTEHGSFTIPVLAPSGLPGSTIRIDSSWTDSIDEYHEVYSPVYVGVLTAPVKDIAVSLYLTHPADEQLEIRLQGPDGTVVDLSTSNGGPNANYGAGCSTELRTIFSDSALIPITAGSAPFVGTFRPEQPWSAFVGRFGQAVNGTWYLRVKDITPGGTGFLNCWSLFLTAALCSGAESGPCEACPAQSIQGVAGTALQIGSLQSGQASRCGLTKVCPGEVMETNALARSYDEYTFLNGESNACITVTLSAEAGMFSAAYSNAYNPFNLCENYLADGGWYSANWLPRSYAFDAPANAIFVVAVWSDGLRGTQPYPYTLQVSGGSCRPILTIDRAPGNKALVDWSTSGVGWQLEATNQLINPPHPGWADVTNEPAVIHSRFQVTNSLTPGSKGFYQLRKP